MKQVFLGDREISQIYYRGFKQISFISIILLSAFVLFKYYITSILVLFIFVLCVLSMQHLRFMPWFGGFDLNIILTVYTGVTYGLPAAFFIGNASTLGLILSGDIDNGIVYDFVISYAIAFLSSFFALSMFVPVVTSMSIIYTVGYIIYHKMFGTLEIQTFSWAITNFLWIMFVVHKVLPLFS